jgi:hypothetical protein
MDLDSSDNIYVAGQTSSFDFPLVNALQPEHNGHGDCFVFKMNSTGTNLEFSTYVGGWLDDTAFDIAVNESGDIFVGARTRSPDFPIINAFDRTHNGDYDFVLFQLDPTGTNLMYSTFIGGSSYEWVLEMTADNSGNVYIAGSTDSYDFPTINADDSSPNGGGECVVLKIYPSPTDGDANRFSDFLFFTSLSGTPIIVLLLLFVGRHKIRLLLLSRIPTDPSKRARVAGYLFGVLVLFLPYGFSYRPDYLAQLSWTQREFSISLGLFAIKNNGVYSVNCISSENCLQYRKKICELPHRHICFGRVHDCRVRSFLPCIRFRLRKYPNPTSPAILPSYRKMGNTKRTQGPL